MKEIKMRFANKVSQTIRKIKSSSGLQKKNYLAKVKQDFEIKDNEKCVLTKLRMILFKLGVNLDLFQLHEKSESNSERRGHKHRYDQNDMANPRMKNSRERCLDATQVARKLVKRNPRMTMEEKQLIKLRSLANVMESPIFQTTKEEFLGVFNLSKTQGKLKTSMNPYSKSVKEEKVQSRDEYGTDVNNSKVNVLEALKWTDLEEREIKVD